MPPMSPAASAPPAPAEAPYDESAEDLGSDLSQSLLAGRTVKPGDTVTLKVVSVNDENGTFKATANDSESAEAGPTIENMASAFDAEGAM